MIKLVIFDLDGVLFKSKEIHYTSLNDALSEEYKISWDDHIHIYDGLKTYEKLSLLTKKKGLPTDLYNLIWKNKQTRTQQLLKECFIENKEIIESISFLKANNISVAVCSNSIRETVTNVLTSLKIIDLIDCIISNEDVKNSKPHPEMYWKCMSHFSLFPHETIIFEDSPYGLKSAYSTGASVIRVKSPDDITTNNMTNILNQKSPEIFSNEIWKDTDMNIIIPMAGRGSRFLEAGYTFPKPLIDVNGKPMIQRVIENLQMDGNYIFIAQREHDEKYNIENMLKLIVPNCRVVFVDEVTEGAACTALLASEFIDNDSPLFFANSDQIVEWDPMQFMYKMQEQQVDGGIVTFESTHPKWSYAEVDENNKVVRVEEKNPISTHATVGYYYWKHGSDFVKYANQMIEKNIRVNNEFYVCPVFNEAIQDDKRITISEAERMWGLGTPEDLEHYLKETK